MKTKLTIRLRSYGDAYVARCKGQTASCTSDALTAVERLAMKLKGLPIDHKDPSYIPFEDCNITVQYINSTTYTAQWDNETPAMAAPTKPSAAGRFTSKEVMDGIRELYAEWQKLRCAKEGLSAIRLPDFEVALTQVERALDDTARLDWIEKQSDGSTWTARQSTPGRGFRLHNIGHDNSPSSYTCRDTVRAAIDVAISLANEVA